MIWVSEKTSERQSKKVPSEEILGEQGFQYEANELFETISGTLEDSIKKSSEKVKQQAEQLRIFKISFTLVPLMF